MTINQMICELEKMRNIVGGDHEVAVVRTKFGENDYLIPEFGTVGEFEDQDGYEYKCALVATIGGEEFTERGTPHYKWEPKRL